GTQARVVSVSEMPTLRPVNSKKSMIPLRRAFLAPAVAGAFAASVAIAQTPAQSSKPFELDSTTIAGFRWRNVGPANTMGRISDVVGLPSPSKTFFAAAAAGGIWKSTN